MADWNEPLTAFFLAFCIAIVRARIMRLGKDRIRAVAIVFLHRVPLGSSEIGRPDWYNITHPKQLVVRNRLGDTALQLAGNHIAVVHALEILVERYPPVLDMRTSKRRHAQEIFICQLFKEYNPWRQDFESYQYKWHAGPSRPYSIFDWFWNKVQLLALAAFFPIQSFNTYINAERFEWWQTSTSVLTVM